MICSCVVKQKRNDCLVTMHTSIARGDVWCKNYPFSALPQSARPVTEEEEKNEDDEKIGKARVKKNCSSGNAKIPISLKGIA